MISRLFLDRLTAWRRDWFASDARAAERPAYTHGGDWVLVGIFTDPVDLRVFGPFATADEAREVANQAAGESVTWEVMPLGGVA